MSTTIQSVLREERTVAVANEKEEGTKRTGSLYICGGGWNRRGVQRKGKRHYASEELRYKKDQTNGRSGAGHT